MLSFPKLFYVYKNAFLSVIEKNIYFHASKIL